MNTSDNDPVATTRQVKHTGGTLHVVERTGEDPPIVLMHGFPDDHRIYDRLTPLLGKRTVAFDFLGYGQSDRPSDRTFDRDDRQRDLTAVIESLDLDRVVLVGHDSSGPEAIQWTLEHSERVERLALLNTYYGHHPSLQLPEMIRLLADRALRPLADAMVEDPQQRLWLLGHTAKQLGLEVGDQEGVGLHAIAPQFFEGPAGPDALTEIRAWTADLFAALDAQDERIKAGDLGTLSVPVSVVFGADDRYLSPDLGRHLASQFPHAELRVVEQAGHWLQWDQPQVVADAITAMAAPSTTN